MGAGTSGNLDWCVQCENNYCITCSKAAHDEQFCSQECEDEYNEENPPEPPEREYDPEDSEFQKEEKDDETLP